MSGLAPARLRRVFQAGLLPVVFVGILLAAGGAPAELHHPLPGDPLVSHETPPEAFTFQSGRSWRATAERLERHNNLNGVLRHLDRVLERETGSAQAEARLWRGAFIYRHGLREKAGAVFDSLLAESSRYSMLLAAPIAENAWRAALANDRPAAAVRALDAWRDARRRLGVVGLLGEREAGAGAGDDSTYAEAWLQVGQLYLKWDRDPQSGRRAVERALAAGLSGPREVEARLILARQADAEGAHDQAADALSTLLESAPRGLPRELAGRVRQARADAEYNAGRFGEARLHYDELLPLTKTAADSQWVLMQIGDSSHQIGEEAAALDSYEEYLRTFPGSTWADWIQFCRSGIDTTGMGS